MPHFTMDCYYCDPRGGDPELRDRVKIRAPGRSIAIEEALRRAEYLRPNYFEVRDPQFDNVLYNSMTDGRLRRASQASDMVLPCAMPGAVAIPLGSPPRVAPSFSETRPVERSAFFKTLNEFQQWFDAQMKAHKRTPYPLLQAAMKKKAAKRKSLPGRGAGVVSPLSSGSDRTVRKPRSRTRSSPQNGQASAELPSS
jgi:hypothetical protein